MRVPALGAEGWFSEEGGPALIASRCTTCATLAFPPAQYLCANPACAGRTFDEVRLASTGTIWSYTDLRYQPPPPFISPCEPYQPYALVAVEPDGSGLVILGQAVDGISVDDLRVGERVELVIDTLYRDGDCEYTVWKWSPMEVTE
jgi:uncharacterized OB-fold protein